MDYGRFNYVAQPGDGARLIPMIGPYDKFAVEWGYKPFPEATTFDAEKAKLDEIVARQIKDVTLRFGDPTGSDPSAQTEDLGSDAVAATDLGLKNLDRVASYLVKATSKKGEDYELLRNMYQQLLASGTASWGTSSPSSAGRSRRTSGSATPTSGSTRSRPTSRRKPSPSCSATASRSRPR